MVKASVKTTLCCGIGYVLLIISRLDDSIDVKSK